MVISHAHQYVYIGIPRTSSKSMTEWLIDHYQGEYVGYHHQWRVPDEARDYLKFTVVRNPYDRYVSGAFTLPWGGSGLEQHESNREQRELVKPTESVEERIQEAALLKDATVCSESKNVPENVMNQYFYTQRSGVSLVLFFERFPECLRDLPFVDTDSVPEYPHVLERGIRPHGNFFDHFDDDEEKIVWAYASEDFNAFGYQRFEVSLPEESPSSLAIK